MQRTCGSRPTEDTDCRNFKILHGQSVHTITASCNPLALIFINIPNQDLDRVTETVTRPNSEKNKPFTLRIRVPPPRHDPTKFNPSSCGCQPRDHDWNDRVRLCAPI